MIETHVIIENIDFIRSSAEEFGLENLKTHPHCWAPIEKNALNFIVTLKDKTSPLNVEEFRQALEKKLGCNVNVYAKELIDNYPYQLRQDKSIEFTQNNISAIQKLLEENLPAKLSKKELVEDSTISSYRPNFFSHQGVLKTKSSFSPLADLLNQIKLLNLEQLKDLSEAIDKQVQELAKKPLLL